VTRGVKNMRNSVKKLTKEDERSLEMKVLKNYKI